MTMFLREALYVRLVYEKCFVHKVALPCLMVDGFDGNNPVRRGGTGTMTTQKGGGGHNMSPSRTLKRRYRTGPAIDRERRGCCCCCLVIFKARRPSEPCHHLLVQPVRTLGQSVYL